jgi:SAM-dependent methyltransferase
VDNFGNNYSDSYDLIHSKKKYEEEVQQIIEISEITPQEGKKLLDFGCGTGLHVKEFLKRGFDIYGFDISPSMLRQARSNNPGIENFSNNLNDLPENFDLTYSLFDVISYQDSSDSLSHYMTSLIKKTKIGGVIMLDGWHAQGAKLDPPKIVERSFILNGVSLKRIVKPLTPPFGTENVYPLQINIEDSVGNVSQEIHNLRAFSESEIRELLMKFGCTGIEFRDGKDYQSPLKSNSFRFFVKAQIDNNLN